MADSNDNLITLTEAQLQGLVTQVLDGVNKRIEERLVDSVKSGDSKHIPTSAAVADHTHDERYYLKSETMSKEQIQEALDEITANMTPAKVYLDPPSNISFENTDEGAIIKWTDPENVTDEASGRVIGMWSGTVVVRKVGSAPTSRTDGVIVVDSRMRNQYKDTGYQDTGLVNGTEYYYGIFPYNDDDVCTYESITTFTSTPIVPSAPTNVAIMNGILSVCIAFTKPEDATSVKIAYKAGSAPVSPEDGTCIVAESSPVTISGLLDNTEYFFVVYACNEKRYNGAAPASVTSSSLENYAFVINDNESSPKSKVTYPAGSINSWFAPAHMDYNSGKFDYGSWKDAFFIKNLRVVMLNFDGTEAYEIDPNDYTKKKDGSPVGTEGNVMIAIPKVYYKVADNGNGSAIVYVAPKKVDADYKCWAHIGHDGEEKDYCYIATYDGTLIDDKLRSLSGHAPLNGATVMDMITYATANNINSDDKNWYTSVVADRFLIQILLLLIGKSTDTQTVFGKGLVNCSKASDMINSGSMDDRGLFWGESTGGKGFGVKVFGIENFWGNIYKRLAGWMDVKGVDKIKMTYGTQDGSTVEGYNITGDGYVTEGLPKSTSTQSGFFGKATFHPFGIIPVPNDESGSATTGYCDRSYIYNIGDSYAYVGGNWGDSTGAGAFYVNMTTSASFTNSYIGASLSYKK